jgi:hypothetical protein
MKIYTNDPVCPYRTTKVNPFQTRAEIDGLLARWGIKKTAWDFDPDKDVCALHFQFQEKIGNMDVFPIMKMEPPRIWDKGGRRGKHEKVNWSVSLRVLYWYLKTHLEFIYLSQSDKTIALLPYMETQDGHSLKDALIPFLSHEKILMALPEKQIADQDGPQN